MSSRTSARGAMAGPPPTGATAAAPPTGTMAFLFSDIEGSTSRWERHRDAMAVALRRHDALVRDAIESRGGYVFKTIGDAFCAAFPTVSGATLAALDVQRALGREDWSAVAGLRVRIALHVGSADERDGDYFGPTVNRVARLLVLAHGGQIVVSAGAAALTRDDLCEGAELIDCGTHRLKDLAEPEHVFALAAPGLQRDFPPLRSVGGFPNNLPAQLGAFVGREDEVAEIERLLGAQRALTLVGAGGIGKTRTALRVAADVGAAFPDGAWFVELAPLVDGATIVPALAALFAVAEAPDHSLLESVVRALRFKTMLLVFDNCEHLVREASGTIERILRGAPNVRVLATSREPLGIAGECVFRMPSLGLVPLSGVPVDAETTRAYGAVALFALRARDAVPSFELTDANAPLVADIARRLDGIPFAIELAAARLRVLTLAQLAEGLGQRFRVLTGGARNAPTRQQTMRAMIDWSYDLLAPLDRAVFRRLAIFNDGWTLESATAVVSDGAIEPWDVVDAVGALADKSLVLADVENGTDVVTGERRFRMLESTREYALEKLREAGEAQALGRKHAERFASFASRLANARKTVSDSAWLDRALAELQNVRGALLWSIDEGNDVALGIALVAGYTPLWTLALRGVGRRYARAARARLDASVSSHARAQLLAALAIHAPSGPDRILASTESLAAARAQRDQDLLAGALTAHARNLVDAGRFDEAATLLREALVLHRAAGDLRSASLSLTYLSDIARWTGDRDASRTLIEESIEAATTAQAERALAIALGSSAEFESDCDRTDRAATYTERALALFLTIRDLRNVAVSHANLAAYALAADRVAEARAHAAAALAILREQEDDFLQAMVLEHLAVADGLEGDFERAARLLGYSSARYRALEMTRERSEQRGYERLVALLTRRFGEVELAALFAAGAALTDEAALAEARA